MKKNEFKQAFNEFLLEETMQNGLLGGNRNLNDTATGDTNSGTPEKADDCDCDDTPIIIVTPPPTPTPTK